MQARLSLAVMGGIALIGGWSPAMALLGRSFSVAAAEPMALAASLEEQLDIQPYNATQGPARDVADRWMQVGSEFLAEGDYSQAIAAWQEAATLYQVLGDNEAAGRAYGSMGATYVRLGNYTEAERVIRLRIAAARDRNNPIGASYGLNNLGTLYLNRGRLELAQELFTEALQLAQEADHRHTIGLSLSNLGLVAIQVDDFDTAVKLLESATNYRYLAGDYLGEANSSNSLGDVYVALGRSSNAIGAYRVALRAGADANDRALQMRALDGLLGIYFEREDWRAVRDYLNRRTALTLDHGATDAQAAVTLRWLGDYYLAQGQTATAAEFYGQALGVARSFDNTTLETELTNRILRL